MTPTELRTKRKALGYTQADMALALGTPYRTYQDWELGRYRIPGVVDIALSCIKPKKKKEDNLIC